LPISSVPCFHPRHQHPTPPEWPSQEESGSGLTASAPVSDVSAPAYTNGVWPIGRPVSVAQKNKLPTMLSSNVQSIDLPMDGTAWQFWITRQSIWSTPATRSNPVKQWIVTTRSNDKIIHINFGIIFNEIPSYRLLLYLPATPTNFLQQKLAHNKNTVNSKMNSGHRHAESKTSTRFKLR